ncbi:hypothetical protein B0A49_00869 [Cryomyces minteri]|uniref:Uncharacterized protein n=1 Tax=Cryomyces minteri TaxID=331657 RepID=A0A4U0XVJ2_9PEZI|nr:hypothetical protein B0A49_03572 [Cryomyces minteri]TKA80681.1 hypothetical protein B0A49_01630 [Cryomyces minteri]TKA81410.1 hypothetical protein B0A49_00869 [Cryomyces minteri]
MQSPAQGRVPPNTPMPQATLQLGTQPPSVQKDPVKAARHAAREAKYRAAASLNKPLPPTPWMKIAERAGLPLSTVDRPPMPINQVLPPRQDFPVERDLSHETAKKFLHPRSVPEPKPRAGRRPSVSSNASSAHSTSSMRSNFSMRSIRKVLGLGET